MVKRKYYLRERKDSFVLGNGLLEAAFPKKRGNLIEFILKKNNFGRWNGSDGHLIIEDELKEKKFQDTQSPLKIHFEKGKTEEGLYLASTKRFAGADFSVKEIWEITKETLNWKVEVTLAKGARNRSLKIRQHFPYYTITSYHPSYSIGLWMAHWLAPTHTSRVSNFRIAYGDVCFGTLIPSITLYMQNKDVGFTIVKPFGFKTSQLFFHFLDYRSTGVYLETEHLGLKQSHPAATSFMIHPHEGDWRPALGWLYKKYPDYFNPVNKKVREIEGGYAMGGPNTPERSIKEAAEFGARSIKEAAEFGVKWEELHHHHPHYGQYAPKDREEWPSVLAMEKPDKKAWHKSGIKRINKVMALFKKYGIRSMPYFQCTGDAWIPSATKHFPDSIAKDVSGKQMAWIECCFVNADPQTKFGREMLDMIDRFVAMYPEMDGVFVDQLCYDFIDTAHDDGITMYKNKPAYKYWHSYEKPLKKLADIIHAQGKIMTGNGPVNIEVQKDIDMHMAEALGWVVKYLCIAKPLIFLVYAKDAAQTEGMFLNCLLAGASYSANFQKRTKEIDRVYDIYRPLLEPIYGRKWLLERDPITVPEGMEGNIFKGETGNYIVTLVARSKSILEKRCLSEDAKIELRFKDAPRIKKGYSLGTSYKGKRKVFLKKKDGKLTITIPEHFTATTVILEK